MIELFIIFVVLVTIVKFFKALTKPSKGGYEEDPCAGCKHNKGASR